jgi:acetyltransferase-like isoleucine patch superfamily enzyme
MKLFHKIRSLLWKDYLRLHGAIVGKNFLTSGTIDILLRDGASLKNLIIGNNVTLEGKTYVRMRKNGKIILNDGLRVCHEVWLVTANDAELYVGRNTVLSSYSIFNGGHGLRIGDNCLFGCFVYINSSDHNYKRNRLIKEQGHSGFPITIGDDVWLGGHVLITSGVTIRTGAIVGGGSVVTKDIAGYKIAVGNPAKTIKSRT